MTTIETLLRASIELQAQAKYIAKLEADNDALRRELGKARLLADLKRDLHDLHQAETH